MSVRKLSREEIRRLIWEGVEGESKTKNDGVVDSFVWQDFSQKNDPNIPDNKKYEYKFTPRQRKIEIIKPKPMIVDPIKHKKAYDAILNQFRDNEKVITNDRSYWLPDDYDSSKDKFFNES